ncbi:hypothetical protein TNCV_963791 [Trichonephila clavipes]|nr:hypothetical protein TNCV_963791 [Trichonephila clavipes]
MGDFTYAENSDMHYMYGRANGNNRAPLPKYHAQFPDQRMPDHRIFQRSHRQLRETCSFHVTRHDAGRQKSKPGRLHWCAKIKDETVFSI